MIYDTIIIGAGPAGMTAGIYMLREKKKVLILERNMYGGQASDSPRIENYPGIKSVSGFDLMNSIYEQLKSLNGEITFEEALNIKKEDNLFKVSTDLDTYIAKSVIISSGCKHRKLGILGEEKFIGNGISYCATCDGAYFEGKDVILIGDANSALQYALSLSDICKTVKIYALFDKFFAENYLVERVKNKDNIEYYFNMESKEFIGDKTLEGVKFYNKETKEESVVKCDGCFIAIGQLPDSERYNIPLKNGYILTNNKLEVEDGIFAAGDCRDKTVRQVATAIGDGAASAVECMKYLQKVK